MRVLRAQKVIGRENLVGVGVPGWYYLWLEGNYELFYRVEIRERSLLNVAFYCSRELEGKSENNLSG